MFIDGDELDEPYIEDSRRDHAEGSYPVPAGHFFLMGDSRAISCDSRVFGTVQRENVQARVADVQPG